MKFATKFFPNPEKFENAYRAGYQFVELALDSNRLMSKQTLSKTARSYDFEYAIHFPNEEVMRPEIVRNAIQLVEEVQSSVLVIHPEILEHHREALEPIRQKLSIENRNFDKKQLEDWAESNDRLTLDIEKLWMHSAPEMAPREFFKFVEQFIETWSHKIKHIHISGYVPGFDAHRPLYCSRELGRVVYDSLNSAKYSGMLVVEVEPEDQTLHSLRMDRLLFDQWQLETAEGPAPGIVPSLPTGVMPNLTSTK